MNVPTLSIGASIAGDFEIVRPLGSGGMGSVYVVLQRSTGRQRALKVMLPELTADPELRQRFEQEARIGSLIESEHVVEVVAAGIEPHTLTPWLVMELLTGEDLATVLERSGSIDASETRRILEQLCHALGAAHQAGIVHRDLKPENVFLAQSKRASESRIVKVLDFGIAKIVADATSTSTAAQGSPLWMAPEQTERGVITPAADVWALGLLAFTMLTGRSFWLSADRPEARIHHIVREVVLDAIPAATARAAQLGVGGRLPEGFDAWYARCVTRAPVDRFCDARDAWRAFAAVLDARVRIPPETGSHGGRSAQKGRPEAEQPRRAAQAKVAPLALGFVAIVAIVASLVALGLSKRAQTPFRATVHAPKPLASDDAPPIADELPQPVASVAPARAKAAPVTPVAPQNDAPTARSQTPRDEAPKAPPWEPAPTASDSPQDEARARVREVTSSLGTCKRPGGPSGLGRVVVTFAPDGHVSSVEHADPYAGTAVGKCLSDRIHAVRIAPFSNGPITVNRVFDLR